MKNLGYATLKRVFYLPFFERLFLHIFILYPATLLNFLLSYNSFSVLVIIILH